LKQSGRLIVWPSNLDSVKSRNEGRKVPKGVGVQSPRLEEISQAAERLSLEPELAPGKSRPDAWWERGGYAILPRHGTRNSILRSLASEIRKMRAAKAAQEKTRK